MRSIFSVFHPVVRFAYLGIAILTCMLAFHPVYVGISLVGAFAGACAVKGLRATVRSLVPIAAISVLIALGNLAFVSAGSTGLLFAFGRWFYLEALCYGATAGGMFAAMMLWFEVYAAVMDSEASSAVMGNVAPLVSLMVSQVMRLVPQFVRRGRAIGAVQGATSAARVRKASRRDAFASRMRTLTALLGWGMEDGIVRAQAMGARGYGCGAVRTRYRRQPFSGRDAAALGIVVALGVLNAFLAAVACSQFGFYPYLDTLVMWWGYVPFAIFVLLPAGLAAWEALSWR